MASNPGMLVKFTDHDGIEQKGIIYRKEGLIKGKAVVHYVDGNFKPIKEDIKGEQVDKKRLIEPDKLKTIGYVD